MRKLKTWVPWVLIGLLHAVMMPNSAPAQEIELVVIPEEMQLQPGESQQIEVMAFRDRIPVEIDSLTWEISPEALGTITDDGFFVAGREVETGDIEVVAYVGDERSKESIEVVVGEVSSGGFKVVVEPDSALVPPGDEQQFEVHVATPTGHRIKPRHVRWEVKPADLGKINTDGLFTAGDESRQGKVIAVIDVERLTFRGTARVTVSPPPTNVISGVVTDEVGAPLQGAKVKAIRLGDIHWVREARTDADGAYGIDALIPGFYVLRAKADGFVAEFYDDTRKYAEALPVQVTQNDTVDGINFALSEGGKITGTVITEADSVPLPGAHVKAILVVSDGKVSYHALTEEDGSYSIDGLPPGSYLARANADGYAAEYFDDAGTAEEATLLTIETSEIIDDIYFALSTRSAIRGHVRSAVDESPIADARVLVFKVTDLPVFIPIILRETRTDEDGAYTVQVRPGDYYVHASAEGFNGEFYDDADNLSSATVVEVVADSHTTDIDFELTPRGSISGTVADAATEEPIAGAVVQAFLDDPYGILEVAPRIVGFRARTDSSGQYTIANLPEGEYIVRALSDDYLTEYYEEADNKGDATPVLVEEGANVEGIDFTLTKGGSIAGLVASEVDSLPIAGALVTVWRVGGSFHETTYSEEDGSYEVGGLRSGEYYVHVIAEGHVPEFFDNARTRKEATPVEVDVPETTSGIDVYLQPFETEGGTIVGRVTSEADESPIPGAVVVAVSPEDKQPHLTFSGPRGFYALTGLPTGDHYVFAWAPRFLGEFYDDAKLFRNADLVAVEEGEVTTGIDFELTPLQRRGIYAIRGEVRSKTNNEPLEGVFVHARVGDERTVTALSDAEGRYEITDVPPGAYTIEATGVGYATGYFGGTNSADASPVSVGDGQDAEEVDVLLEPQQTSGVDDGLTSLPERFDLFQNYPNPFNPETAIKFQIPNSVRVTVKVYNILGQEIRTLADEAYSAGVYTVVWDGKDDLGRPVASGVYIYRIAAGDRFKASRRMLLLK